MGIWLRATVTVPHDSGLPRDAIQNTWAFSNTGTVDRDLAAVEIDTRLTAFYNALNTFLSSQYTWADARVSIVDMTDAKPRIPYYDEALGLTEAGTTINDMPAEVAVCLSFQSARASGYNMRRRRGRVFVGPFAVGSADQAQVQSGLYGLIATAAADHLLNYTPALVKWSVYSPYTHHGIAVGDRLTKDDPEVPDFLPASFTQVARLWVDNAWDTQRRRGPKASARTIIDAS